jgi:multiple sugar transport system substrate-binding protein
LNQSRYRMLLFIVLSMIFVLGACSSNDAGGDASPNGDAVENNGDAVENENEDEGAEEEQGADTGELEPVTIKVLHGPWEEIGEKEWIKPLEEAYPHITIEVVPMGDGGMEELISAQNIPDIRWHYGSPGQQMAEEFELGYDMSELIDQFNFDLSRYNEQHLAEWQAWTDGEIWTLPFARDHHALHYNKDIFDLFGVPYPEDGMTWHEVVELASQVTGERDGVHYQGLYLPQTVAPIAGMVPNLVDPETHEPIWTEDDTVREYFSLYKQNYSIPGNPWIPRHWDVKSMMRKSLASQKKWPWSRRQIIRMNSE